MLENGDATIAIVGDPTAGTIRIDVHNSVTATLECGRYLDALQLTIGDVISPLWLGVILQQGMLTLQRWRTGGNQNVTVKHVYQQVNVTEGGQAVVAGNKVVGRTKRRRRGASGGNRRK